MTRYQRLLYILNLLYSQKNLNARQLAEKCGVSRRTIYRDIMTLSEANIPIYYDNGYQLLRTYALPPIMLSAKELALMNLALNSSPLMALTGVGGELEKLRIKLNNRIKNDINGKQFKIDQALNLKSNLSIGNISGSKLFNQIEESLSKSSKIEMVYTNIHGSESTRIIHPYHLIFRGRAFYLLAWCEKRDEYRLFRLERIQNYNDTGEIFKKDPDFSLDKLFHYSWGVGGGEPYDIKVKFSKQIAYMFLSGKRHETEEITQFKDGSIEYRVRASGLDEIARWLVGFGKEARVIYPRELIDKMLDLAQGAARRYK